MPVPSRIEPRSGQPPRITGSGRRKEDSGRQNEALPLCMCPLPRLTEFLGSMLVASVDFPGPLNVEKMLLLNLLSDSVLFDFGVAVCCVLGEGRISEFCDTDVPSSA